MKSSQELIKAARKMISDARKEPEPSPEVGEQLFEVALLNALSALP